MLKSLKSKDSNQDLVKMFSFENKIFWAIKEPKRSDRHQSFSCSIIGSKRVVDDRRIQSELLRADTRNDKPTSELKMLIKQQFLAFSNQIMRKSVTSHNFLALKVLRDEPKRQTVPASFVNHNFSSSQSSQLSAQASRIISNANKPKSKSISFNSKLQNSQTLTQLIMSSAEGFELGDNMKSILNQMSDLSFDSSQSSKDSIKIVKPSEIKFNSLHLILPSER